MKKIIAGVTGASGSIYAKNFIKRAAYLGLDLRLIASDMGASVFKHETGESISDFVKKVKKSPECTGSITLYDNSDMFADIASGSCRTEGMIILPCSVKTLACVANGIAGTLLERAADVTLKEGRKLILAVRETPLSLVHLRNMTLAAEAGAVILPASPGFYHSPASIDELADFISGKIFDQLNIEHGLDTAWKSI
ncbi:MAG TPA: UbiX family flavin prenyltransferase [Spirochaetota bacterium]|nr:UbiX family flavin prenyltransferase [Spirochaetota bacterium]HPF04975.1 UbiX family flavin prenyltransferase [Spirochaetota bacterium]HPJ42305.1 UbiX family flavin prenyltransferase [Spirochaetota bacterium]HPR37133.1 UbiX family flavin prenyltransferase [Spirochaetota bacterium]HRX46636.1 UbiX family flavin prenyltransferase [Spirochaetota bacterium]